MKPLVKVLILLIGILVGFQLGQWKHPSPPPPAGTVTLRQVDTVTVQQVLHDTVIRFVDRIRFQRAQPETVLVSPIRGDTVSRFLGLDYAAPRLEVFVVQNQTAKRLIYRVPPVFSLRYDRGRLFREVPEMVDRTGRVDRRGVAGARARNCVDAHPDLGMPGQPEGAACRRAGGVQPHGGPHLEVLNAA